MRFRHRDRETSELTDIGPGRLTEKDEAEFRELRDQLERELDELADDTDPVREQSRRRWAQFREADRDFGQMIFTATRGNDAATRPDDTVEVETFYDEEAEAEEHRAR